MKMRGVLRDLGVFGAWVWLIAMAVLVALHGFDGHYIWAFFLHAVGVAWVTVYLLQSQSVADWVSGVPRRESL